MTTRATREKSARRPCSCDAPALCKRPQRQTEFCSVVAPRVQLTTQTRGQRSAVPERWTNAGVALAECAAGVGRSAWSARVDRKTCGLSMVAYSDIHGASFIASEATLALEETSRGAVQRCRRVYRGGRYTSLRARWRDRAPNSTGGRCRRSSSTAQAQRSGAVICFQASSVIRYELRGWENTQLAAAGLSWGNPTFAILSAVISQIPFTDRLSAGAS